MPLSEDLKAFQAVTDAAMADMVKDTADPERAFYYRRLVLFRRLMFREGIPPEKAIEVAQDALRDEKPIRGVKAEA